MKWSLLVNISLLVLLAACTTPPVITQPAPATAQPKPALSPAATAEPAMGGGMGMRSGMMERHRAPIPAPYAGQNSPIPVDAGSIARGEVIFGANCATCHGDGGMGDGPGGAALNPSPAPVAHTSQMMGDDYLFWRISEGGAPFGTGMPVWKDVLDEQARWDVINYVRALGAGQVRPGQGMGGAAADLQAETAQRTEMLVQAVEQALITQAEADAFAAVHEVVDAYRAANPTAGVAGNPGERQATMLAALVRAGKITQAQADTFSLVHDRLLEAGVMH